MARLFSLFVRLCHFRTEGGCCQGYGGHAGKRFRAASVELCALWIKSEGPEFNQRLWAMTFKEVYRGKPGPARVIESIRFLAPKVATVQARANHPDGVILNDGTYIPPFWEINTYTLIRTDAGWRVALLNIHNQINPGSERAGQRVPDASTRAVTQKQK